MSKSEPRFGAGYAQKNPTKHEEAAEPVASEKMKGVIWIHGAKDRGVLRDSPQPERRNGYEPKQHNRAECSADPRRAKWLSRKQQHQNSDRGWYAT
jgi:hypothetical protein